MSGTFTPKVLSEGQLSAGLATVYTAPALTDVYVHTVLAANVSVGETEENVVLYYQRTTEREIGRAKLSTTGWRAEMLERPIHLEAGDKLRMSTDHAASVDILITGIEES